MTKELKGGDNAQTLSTDINVITAEINGFINAGMHNFFEAGKRLKHAKENLVHGKFGVYAKDKLTITASQASNLISAYEQFGHLPTSASLGMSKIFEMISLPIEIDRQEFVEQSHEIPSTGETKTPDEMTVRELREVKRELKKTQEQRDAEQRERERLEIENSELADREPEVRTEYVEKETREPYDRRLDEPYSVERGRAFYAMMNEVDALYKKYAHLKDGIEELRGLAVYDEDMRVKYRKASEFWHMMDGVFNEDINDIIDIEII